MKKVIYDIIILLDIILITIYGCFFKDNDIVMFICFSGVCILAFITWLYVLIADLLEENNKK